MSKTATLWLSDESLDRHGGKSRVYKLSEPKTFNHKVSSYVLIKVQEPWSNVEAKVTLFPCNEEGFIVGQYAQDYAGAHTCEGNPFMDPAHLEGCYWLALQLCGYSIEYNPA